MGRFGSARRVRKRAEFREIQGAGRRVSSRHFLVLVYVRGHGHPTRLGLVVSRRVGNAVRRNRAKRLIREAFRHCPGWWQPGADLVVIARQWPPRMRQSELNEEFQRLTPALERGVQQAEKDPRIRQSKLADPQ
jgi:ribonuclease P protein component